MEISLYALFGVRGYPPREGMVNPSFLLLEGATPHLQVHLVLS